MKSQRARAHKNTHNRKAACTISAAALMLGVSHAATIGFNFTANYCNSAAYSGAYVTATAFGITTNGWESLSQMDTGYGCASGVGPYTLNEVIDTTTSTGGLNPLANGSLNVSWSAYESNVSGFGGYAAAPPHYTFSGSGHKPGEQEVYWGFLRDGVNFGSGESGGDNNQESWSVDITGLKTVFTNSAFVVETIGAGDSIENLTNVFVIDATLLATQSVTYPNIPPISNVGDTAWPRGIGGGLSTGSGSVSTDHLRLVGNRAQHSAGPPAFNNASEVAGFILTDVPVVTMSPQPILVSPGDTFTLRAIAIGVPPIAIQWRLGGVPVPGATNLSYTVSNTVAGGLYDLVVTNMYGSTTSKVSTVTLDTLSIATGLGYTPDTKPVGIPHDGEVVGATILPSSTDSLGTNRTGVALFASANSDQIAVSTLNTTDFDSTNGTITFWMQAALVGGTGNSLLFEHGTTTNGIAVLQNGGGSIVVEAAGGGVAGSVDVSDSNWHHVAVVNDNAVGQVIYVDGALDNSGGSPLSWSWPGGQPIDLGFATNSGFLAYNGYLDDVRFYNRVLTATEVASVYSTGALVDTNALKLQLNFTTTNLSPGLAISWQNTNAVLQTATEITGPWTNYPAAFPPNNVEIQSGQMFYRYIHAPATVKSNPYDM